MEDGQIFVDGKKYISSKEAGLRVGYTNDYISKLCRTGDLPAKQIARLWFVEAEALYAFVDKKKGEKERQHAELSKQRREEYDHANHSESGLPTDAVATVPWSSIGKRSVALLVALLAVGGPYVFASTPLFGALQENTRAAALTVVLSVDQIPRAIVDSATRAAVLTGTTLHDVARDPEVTINSLRDLYDASWGAVAQAAANMPSTQATAKKHVDAFFMSVVALPDALPTVARRASKLASETPSAIRTTFLRGVTRLDEVIVGGTSTAAVTFDESVRNLEAPAINFVNRISLAWYETVSRTVASLTEGKDDPILTSGERDAITEKLRSALEAENPLAVSTPQEEEIEVSAPTPSGGGSIAVVTPAAPVETQGVSPQTVERVVERIVTVPTTAPASLALAGISEEEVAKRLAILEGKLQAQIFDIGSLSSGNTANIVNNYTNISNTNKIDDLGSVTIHNSSITSSSFSGTSVSADSGSFGTLGVSGNASISGTLTVQSLGTVLDLLSAPRIAATSTTATSTFAGDVNIDSGGFVYSTTTGNTTLGGQLIVGGTATSTFAGDVAFNTDTLYIDSINGRVGIGTTSPGLRFSVAGSIYSDQDLTATNITATGTATALSFVASGASATSTFAGGLAIETSGFVYDFTTDNVGIGTTSASQKLSVSGSGYFTGGLGVGIATSTAGVLETSGNAYIGGNLTVIGDSVVLGGSTSDSLTINSTINSNLIPDLNATRDIGSPSFYWDDGFFDTITANNLSAASTTISGTQSSTFTINSDNSSSDTESMDLIFFRGTVVPNALLSWDSTNDRFDFNQPLFIQNDDTTTGANITLNLRGQAGQTGALFNVASSSGTSLFSIAANGALTTAGDLTSSGALSGTRLIATDAAATSTFAGGLAVETNGLVYDFSTNRVGIGTASPSSTLHVSASGATIQIDTTNAGAYPQLSLTELGAARWDIEYSPDRDNLEFFNNVAGVSSFVIDDATGFVGIGPDYNDPSYRLDVSGDGRFTGLVDASYLVATSSSATSTFAGGLAVETSGFVYDFSTNNVGIGTASPLAQLHLNTTAGVDAFSIGSSTTQFLVDRNGRVGIGTSTPQRALTVSTASDDILEITNSTLGKSWGFQINTGGSFQINETAVDDRLTINTSGNVGIGTSTPSNRLQVLRTTADPQLRLSYDATRFVDFQVDSVGDLIINPQGDDAFLNDDNLWVCSGGSCPSGTPAGNGNLIVETALGIGTSTPDATLGIVSANTLSTLTANAALQIGQTSGVNLAFDSNVIQARNNGAAADLFAQQFGGSLLIGTTTDREQVTINENLYVGNGFPGGAGLATSTFQGDIIILGKLDVGTIDPVYTIGGVKYATYGHSTIGIKEEVIFTTDVTKLNEETGYYEKRVAFGELEKGTDLWLFYQVTNFGRDWRKLVVTLTPGVDGRVFYRKSPEDNVLVIASDNPGEVSIRLAADRFDASEWPNLRPDQGEGWKGFELDEKSVSSL